MSGITRRESTALIGSALLSSTFPARAQSTKPPIKIGFSMSVSGSIAAGGQAALLTYQIWAEEVNAKGGLLGRKVELVYYDDQSNPATVPAIYAKLFGIDKVDLVISGYGTNLAATAMPTVMEHKKLFLSLFAVALNDKFKYDRYFQIQPNGSSARIAWSHGFYELAAAMDPKPQTVALIGADAEFAQVVLDGARENAKKYGIKIVYDRSFPSNTVDFGSIMRAIKAANPDLIFVASYPLDTVGIIRAAHNVGLIARLFGGGTMGLQYASVKTQLNTMLNNVVSFDLYVPEPTMNFPGIEQFLVRYREKALAAGVDPLGIYIPPFAYAEMQILEQAIKAVGDIDDGKLADYIHKTTFETIVGSVRFEASGEWAEPRILLVQYQNIVGADLEQFKHAGTQRIVYPPKYKSGDLKTPFDGTHR
jgi:branched-chain amino acid transport system substrate-binding protein